MLILDMGGPQAPMVPLLLISSPFLAGVILPARPWVWSYHLAVMLFAFPITFGFIVDWFDGPVRTYYGRSADGTDRKT